MISPFDNYNSHCILYLEPFLNNFHKTYQNIITLSSIPDGPLADLVTTTSISKLSPFQQLNSISSNPSNCTHVLLRYPKNNAGSMSSISWVTMIYLLFSPIYRVMAMKLIPNLLRCYLKATLLEALLKIDSQGIKR